MNLNSITVVYPHFKTLDWLKRSIRSHRSKALTTIKVVVVDTSWKEADNMEVRSQLAGIADHVVWLRINPAVFYFGCALEVSLPLCATISDSDITVMADTDTVMLRRNWDFELRDLLAQHKLVAINPRSNHDKFKDMPEWNWMAFKRGDVVSLSGDAGLTFHDWGHHVAHHLNGSVYLFKYLSSPFPGKMATITGNYNQPWVFHAFFATSKAAGDPRENNCAEAVTQDEIEKLCAELRV